MTLQGWRTIIFNTLVAVLAGVRMSNPDLVLPTDAELASYVDAVFLLIAAGGNILLRIKTTTPVGEKPDA